MTVFRVVLDDCIWRFGGDGCILKLAWMTLYGGCVGMTVSAGWVVMTVYKGLVVMTV